MTEKHFVHINDPLILVYQKKDDRVAFRIHPAEGFDHRHYGILVADLVRYIAKTFKVTEFTVWASATREWHKPTSGMVIETRATHEQ